MTVARLNGITLSYETVGSGELVVLVMGTGSPGRVWSVHQVPALVAAGYRVATFDNRGIPPTDECADGMTIADLVGDTAALIEHLGAPARVVGTSLGSRIVQELSLARPELVTHAVSLAAYARLDTPQKMLNSGQKALYDSGTVLPPAYHAAVSALQNLSPATLSDQATAQDWLEIFELSGSAIGAGARAQLDLADAVDRRSAYRAITVPTLVVGFADDATIPARLSREVADVIPGARYEEIPDTGHLGYLERPAEVNRVVLDFLAT
ncbi:alpha/beta fold hydrolase [Streptomyces sp. NPDC020965]|uniref:alpha/beta fold hydrolase n=1 Tax=Streptomyces sp. NPDC020965 TaxID=3365105 RepID=UPI003787BDB9